MTGVPFKRILDTHPNARLAVEIAFGADLAADPAGWTWTDVTTDVRFNGRVSISPMGRSDNAARAQPAGCSFQLGNSSGDYSKGPSSRHFPYVRRNTPVRVRTTLDGSNWSVRFQGQANGFTPGWDAMGKLPYVTVSASGVLRRLMQGTTPLRSALFRATSTLTGSDAPAGYWPLEDGPKSTQAGSGLPSGSPMTLYTPTGTVINPVPATSPAAKWHETVGTNGSDKIVYLGDQYLHIPLAGTVATSWRVDWIGHYDQYSTGSFTTEMLRVYAGSGGNQWRVAADNVDIYVYFFSDATGEVVITTTGVQIYDGVAHHYGLVVYQNGADIKADLYIDGTPHTGTYTGKTLTAVSGVQAGSEDNYLETAAPKPSVGHIAWWDGNPTGVSLSDAAIGYEGETATDRIARLCAEEGVPVDVRVNADAPSPAMGAQGVDTFVNLLRECEVTDDGVLYDGRGPGLAYASRGVRYNAATAVTIDAAAGQLAGPFAPVDDDQRNRNKVTVTRKGGATSTFEDADGPLGTAAVGVYDSKVSPDPNYVDDSTNVFRAAWEVGKGTVEADYRYPSLALDLCAVPALAADWLAADVSSRIDVTNVDSAALTHPPGDIDLMLEGWSEIVAPNEWTAGCNCSPFEPYRVAVIEGAGDTLWIIDSASSVLDADAAAGATTMSVASDPVELWSTDSGDYPRAVDVGGVKVNVTAVAGAASPQTFTVDPLPFDLAAGARVKLWRPATIAL